MTYLLWFMVSNFSAASGLKEKSESQVNTMSPVTSHIHIPLHGNLRQTPRLDVLFFQFGALAKDRGSVFVSVEHNLSRLSRVQRRVVVVCENRLF